MLRKPTILNDGLPYCSHMVCPKFNAQSGICSELDAEPTAVCVPAVRAVYAGVAQTLAEKLVQSTWPTHAVLAAQAIRTAEEVRDAAREASQRDLELRRQAVESLETVRIVKDGIIERLQGEVDELKHRDTMRERPAIDGSVFVLGHIELCNEVMKLRAQLKRQEVEHRESLAMFSEENLKARGARLASEYLHSENVHTGPVNATAIAADGTPVSLATGIFPGPLTWTCLACGKVHAIDHAGMFCSGCHGMICCGCETKYEPKHNCPFTFRMAPRGKPEARK